MEKTHDLNRLYDLLVERDSDLQSEAEPLCDALVQVYFTDRDPGFDLDDPDGLPLREQGRRVEALMESAGARGQ